MNEQEYQSLQHYEATPARLAPTMLVNREPRTLIYGYTLERDTFHAYLGDDQKIHLVVYDGDRFLKSHRTDSDLEPRDYVPTKRVYPAASDIEFCKLLLRCNVRIPFTTFEARPDVRFHGDILQELPVIPDDFVVPELTLTSDDFEFPADSIFRVDRAYQEYFDVQLAGDIREFLTRYSRRIRFGKEDLERVRWAIPRYFEGVVRSFEQRNSDTDELSTYSMPDSVRQRLTDRVMAVLQ
jgi:hypothetical protein